MLKLVVAAGIVFGVAGTTAGVYYAMPRGEEEVSSQAALPTPAPGLTGAPAPTPGPFPAMTPAATAVPTVTAPPAPSVPPVPADWPTYTDPGGLFTVRYPPTWFERDGGFYSGNPDTFGLRPGLPPEVVKVEVGYSEAAGSSGCGVLSVDPTTGKGSPGAGATPATLGGLPAWQEVRGPGDPAIEGTLTRIQGIVIIHEGYCLHLYAYFTQQNPDVATFEQIASSFRFQR